MKILVLTKVSCGNDTVGDLHTVAKRFDGETPVSRVYEEMRTKGNWDIVIPLSQDVGEDLPKRKIDISAFPKDF